MRILIVEDDRDIASNLHDYLIARGHLADRAADGVTGLRLALAQDYDTILLDLGLPGIDGLAFTRKLREEAARDTPILVLTARDTLEDKLAGFEHGVDDYMVKPFALREVEARLAALDKRRRGMVTRHTLVVGDLAFDTGTLEVTRAGVSIRLPPKCLRLLELLMQQPNHVFSRAELETAVWGGTLESSDTLRAHMHMLRRALTRPARPDPIETVHGLGYRLVTRYET